MNLAEKHNVKWGNRYDVLTVEFRHKIIDDLKEQFKKRGTELKKLIDEHPRLIDENGNATDRLIIVNNKYVDGHIIYQGTDEKGFYAIFQAKNRDENEQWKYIIKKQEKLLELSILQRSLNESNIDYSKIQETKKKIDVLFVEVFDIENNEIQANPYPHLFKEADVYHKFNEYIQKHIVEYYSDYSYLFQRLLNDKLIYPTKHLDFMKWLHDEEFITIKFFELFIEKTHFKSLKKSTSIQRENNFNNIFQ